MARVTVSPATSRRSHDHEGDVPGARPAHAARPGAHDQVARLDLWAHAALRPRALALPLLRPRRARGDLDVGGDTRAAARRGGLRHPLRDALVTAGQSI